MKLPFRFDYIGFNLKWLQEINIKKILLLVF